MKTNLLENKTVVTFLYLKGKILILETNTNNNNKFSKKKKI